MVKMGHMRFGGVIPANLLPFRADLTIDEAAYRRVAAQGQWSVANALAHAVESLQGLTGDHRAAGSAVERLPESGG